MKNADMPAMPVDRETGSDIDAATSSPSKYGMPTGLGMSKREYFAAMAMQGLMSNLAEIRREGFRDEEIEEFAVMRADALLKRLEGDQ